MSSSDAPGASSDAPGFSSDRKRRRAAINAGVLAGLLLELGYIPFDIAAGAAMSQTHVDPAVSIASSPLIFAGASQLVAVQLLSSGAAIPIVVLAVFVVNARHLLYSASLEPHLAEWSRPQRLAAAFFLADPTYALAITRFERPGGAGSKGEQLGYYFGAGITLYVGWAVFLAIGVELGGLIPPWLPLELAVPLTFLLLLIPLIKDRAGLVAAAVGGFVAWVAHPLPFSLGLLVGAATGLLAGGVVLARTTPREHEPAPASEEAPDA